MKTGKATKLNHFENIKNEFNSIMENEVLSSIIIMIIILKILNINY